MSDIAHFLSHHVILLAVTIFVLALLAYSIVKRLAKLALFLVVLAVVAWVVMQWLDKA